MLARKYLWGTPFRMVALCCYTVMISRSLLINAYFGMTRKILKLLFLPPASGVGVLESELSVRVCVFSSIEPFYLQRALTFPPYTQLAWQHRIVHITVRADNEHVKLSCASPNQYKGMLCTTKVYIGTELHCEPLFACLLSILYYASVPLCTTCVCLLSTSMEKVP